MERYKDVWYYRAVAKAIERATGEILRVYFQIGSKYTSERYMAYTAPEEAPSWLPFELNQQYATHWVESDSFEGVWEGIIKAVGLEHRDDWYYCERPED